MSSTTGEEKESNFSTGPGRRSDRFETLYLVTADSALGDERDVAACDAQIVKLTVGQAVQLVAGLTNAVPGADTTEDFHFRIP